MAWVAWAVAWAAVAWAVWRHEVCSSHASSVGAAQSRSDTASTDAVGEHFALRIPKHGLRLPEKGEPLRIVGDISQVNDDARVQKALRRLAADKAPTSLSQLVMWNLAAGLDWNTIAQLSQGGRTATS